MTDVGVPLDVLGPLCPRCRQHHPVSRFPCRSLEDLRTTAAVLRGGRTDEETAVD